MTARLYGVLAVIFAAMLWGTTGTVQALLPEGREPAAVGALRLSFGALSLIALAAFSPESRAYALRLPWRGIIGAGIAIGLYNVVFFQAVSEAGVGIGTAIAIGSAPVLATIYEAVTTGQMPLSRRLLGIGVALAGVAVLGSLSDGTGSALGISLALVAGASYASYSLITSRIGNSAPSASIAAATFTMAAVLTAPVLLVAPLGWLSTPTAWAGLVFLGVAATGLSYALYTWGLARVAASTGVTLALAEPVTALFLATFILGERLTAPHLAAIVLILVGLLVVALTPAAVRSRGSPR